MLRMMVGAEQGTAAAFVYLHLLLARSLVLLPTTTTTTGSTVATAGIVLLVIDWWYYQHWTSTSTGSTLPAALVQSGAGTSVTLVGTTYY
jgi:hypothetical protein